MSGDRQAQAHAAIGPCQRRVALVEALPNPSKLVGAQTDTRVGDRHAYRMRVICTVTHEPDADPSAVGREFQSVAEHAAEDVGDALLVGFDGCIEPRLDIEAQLDLFGGGCAV